MLILPETTAGGRRSAWPRSCASSSCTRPCASPASQAVKATISIGIAGGRGSRAPARHARRSRRCGDVRRQVARPQPHVPVPRARRGGARAACADLGRAPRPGHRHRPVGQRHRHAGARIGPGAAAEPPRPPVRHDRLACHRDRPRDGPAARGDRAHPHRVAPPRPRQDRHPRGDPRQARRPSPTRSGRPSASIPASARSSSSRHRACARRSRSCSTTTSASTAAAIRTACREPRSRSARGSSAVADAYHAMVHDRPYSPALTHAEALGELSSNAGTQFDPEVVEVFCTIYVERCPRRARGGIPAPRAGA